MIILGLTGSIGMGKSTVGKMLERMGCAVHDSDKAVHNALLSKGEAFEEVALTFPTAWDKKTHTINKKKLADIVFSDDVARLELEAILHPIVQKAQQVFIQKQKRLGRKIVVLDIPLLFETGAESRVDYVIVVSAPLHVQRQRVLNRPNMDEEKFQRILSSQIPDKEKCARSDFIIPTGMGMAYTQKSLMRMMEKIK